MFLRIPIGGIKRKSKKKKIGSCGSQFGVEMREIWCLEDWGKRGTSRGGVAAHHCWFSLAFIEKTTGNRLQDIVIDYKVDVLL